MKVIDVSEHNGFINWKKVKASGVNACVIRAGYGRGNDDKQYKNNIEGAIKAGIEYIGLYWFSYAYTVEMAVSEAYFLNELARKYKDKLNLGVYFDWEYDSMEYAKKKGLSMGKRLITDMNLAFCQQIKDFGYIAGYYCNLDYQQNHIDVSKLKGFRKWFAWYGVNADKAKGAYMWQWSDIGTIQGIKGKVDMNELMEEPKTESKPKSEKTVDDIANEVLSGKWGNGYERKSRLKKAGWDYQEIQDRVNELLSKNKKVKTYVVKKDDTLSCIAAKFGTTIKELQVKNNISNPNKIYEGQKLNV